MSRRSVRGHAFAGSATCCRKRPSTCGISPKGVWGHAPPKARPESSPVSHNSTTTTTMAPIAPIASASSGFDWDRGGGNRGAFALIPTPRPKQSGLTAASVVRRLHRLLRRRPW